MNKYKMIIDSLRENLKEKDIKIEQIGNWIWVTGNTYLIKDKLKELGFFYSKFKRAWFYNGMRFKINYSKCKDLNEIRELFNTLLNEK